MLRALGSLGVFAMLVAIVSCEAIVPSDPSYTCKSGITCDGGVCTAPPGPCPQGQYCRDPGCAQCQAPGDDPCDHYDNDCNGIVDDGPLSDFDKDGYTICGQIDSSGHSFNVDCDDSNPDVHPGAKEVCNGLDDDCDNGAADEQVCPVGFVCKPGLQHANPDDNCISTTSDCNTKPCLAPDTCDTSTGQCIPPATNPLGAACLSDRQCMDPNAFCGFSDALGPAAGSGVCTKDCCTSSDCPDQFVCYAPGTDGRYCMKKDVVSIPAVGTLLPGASTSSAASCRSGQMLNGECVDTCCSTTPDCTNGAVCRYTSLFGKVTLGCQPPSGSKVQGSYCGSNPSSCAEGICGSFDLCMSPCCSSATCGGDVIGDYVCRPYGVGSGGSGGALTACAATGSTRGSGASGANCSQDSDCVSLSCTSTSSHPQKFCSDFCCTDSDCQNSTLCRPTPAGGSVYALRCTFP